ncbi:uncharacterized protein [Leptinotarsa decemlineata]|uniref:uncharacterized protein n=1 Tax=Leptinotarsa decemlineata TaxID=7539 RepID=UPI003D30C95C
MMKIFYFDLRNLLLAFIGWRLSNIPSSDQRTDFGGIKGVYRLIVSPQLHHNVSVTDSTAMKVTILTLVFRTSDIIKIRTGFWSGEHYTERRYLIYVAKKSGIRIFLNK